MPSSTVNVNSWWSVPRKSATLRAATRSGDPAMPMEKVFSLCSLSKVLGLSLMCLPHSQVQPHEEAWRGQAHADAGTVLGDRRGVVQGRDQAQQGHQEASGPGSVCWGRGAPPAVGAWARVWWGAEHSRPHSAACKQSPSLILGRASQVPCAPLQTPPSRTTPLLPPPHTEGFVPACLSPHCTPPPPPQRPPHT